eukprot:796533-Prorocentrum_minimum.AAC.5
MPYLHRSHRKPIQAPDMHTLSAPSHACEIDTTPKVFQSGQPHCYVPPDESQLELGNDRRAVVCERTYVLITGFKCPTDGVLDFIAVCLEGADCVVVRRES